MPSLRHDSFLWNGTYRKASMQMHSRCCKLFYGRRKIFRELLLKSVEECCDTRNIFANRHFCYRRMCHKRKRIRHLSRKPGQKVPFCSGQVMLRIDGIASRGAKKRYSCKARLIIEFQIDGVRHWTKLYQKRRSLSRINFI